MKRILNLVSKICLVVTTFVFSVLMVGGQIAFDNKNMVSSFLALSFSSFTVSKEDL